MNSKLKKYILSIIWILFIFFTISIYTYQFINPHPDLNGFFNYILTLALVSVLIFVIVLLFRKFEAFNQRSLNTNNLICPICGLKLTKADQYCPHCGSELN